MATSLPNRSKPIVKELSRHKRPDLPSCSARMWRVASLLVCVVCGYALRIMRLRGEGSFKFYRSKVAEGLVDAASVVEQQVSRNRARGFLASLEMSIVDTLHLDGLEERLGAGVVVGRARAAHALDAADGRDLAPEVP